MITRSPDPYHQRAARVRGDGNLTAGREIFEFSLLSIRRLRRILLMAKRRRGGVRAGAGRKPSPPEERRRNRIMINLDDWNSLTTRQQEIINVVCRENLLEGLAQASIWNPNSL